MKIGVMASERASVYVRYALDLIFSLKGLCAITDFLPLDAKAQDSDFIIHYSQEEMPGRVMTLLEEGRVALSVFFSQVGFDSRPRQLTYISPAHDGERKVPLIKPGERVILKDGSPLYFYQEQEPHPEAAITAQPVGKGLLIRVGYDLLQLVFSMASCQREYYLEQRGTNVASWFGTMKEDQALLQTPIVNAQAMLFFKLMERLLKHGQIPVLTKALHPEGKRFAIGLSHDVEVKKKPSKTESSTPVMLLSEPLIG